MAAESAEPMQRGLWFSRHLSLKAVTRKEYPLHCYCSHLGPKDSSCFSSCINWFSKHLCCCLQLFSSCVLLHKAIFSRTDQAYCISFLFKNWKPLRFESPTPAGTILLLSAFTFSWIRNLKCSKSKVQPFILHSKGYWLWACLYLHNLFATCHTPHSPFPLLPL